MTLPVRQLAPVAGMSDGYSWWEIITPTGTAYEHAYSAEQALRRYEERLRDARCVICGGPLGDDRLRWYGADYCGEECLRRGRQAQWETTQEDKFWESPRSARMGLWPH